MYPASVKIYHICQGNGCCAFRNGGRLREDGLKLLQDRFGPVGLANEPSAFRQVGRKGHGRGKTIPICGQRPETILAKARPSTLGIVTSVRIARMESCTSRMVTASCPSRASRTR